MEEEPFLAGRRAGTFNGFEVIPLRRSQGRQKAHIKGCVAVGLAKKEAAANSRKLARPKRCKKVCVVAKRRRPSLLANSSTSLRSRSVTTRPRLSASKRWSISPWLIGCLKAMQASTSSVAIVSPEFAFARVCSLKYAAKALLWTSVVRSETTPLIIRS
jgi:hypothetical protein